MVKISQLPPDSAPTTTDKVALVDTETNTTKRALLSALITLFFNNIPTGTIPGSIFDYVISGGIWSGDSYGSNRNASMTALSIYINNRTIAITAVVARTFTASKDTYVDVLDNADGTGTLVYTEANNNAASPALASNSVRLAVIVTGAGSIANVGSINQGEPDKILPTITGTEFMQVTDSLGNLICPRDPSRRVLGYRQITGGLAFQNGDITGLLVPIIMPSNNRKIMATVYCPYLSTGSGANAINIRIMEGATEITIGRTNLNNGESQGPIVVKSPLIQTSSGLHTYKVRGAVDVATNVTFNAGATSPAYILIEQK